MSDWKVGDLAVCIDDSPCRCPRCRVAPASANLSIARGKIYRVEATEPSSPYNDRDFLVLVLAGVAKRDGHRRGTNSERFRKVMKADEQFTASIRKRKTVSA